MSYSALSADDIVLSSEAVSTPMWSNGLASISSTYLATQSNQIMGLSSDYYVDYYYAPDTVNPGEEVQFACTFADKYGRGANPYNAAVPENTPTRTIFGQYRSLVLGDEESDFYFGGSGSGATSSSYFWAISIDRARYKESLMVGSLHLHLTGSVGGLDLIDNSTIQSNVTYIDSGRVYNLIEASWDPGSSMYLPVEDRSSISYGYFLPDIGTILLDGNRFRVKISGNGPGTIFDGQSYVSSSNTIEVIDTLVRSIDDFTLQAKETVTSNYVFVRAKNSEFNYSMNPSNITNTGELRYKIMANSPETYITSIGLYNSNNDLVAVAKLSRPLPKNFTKEALFRIKLDY